MNKLIFYARRSLINRKVFRYAKLIAAACSLVLFLDVLPNLLDLQQTKPFVQDRKVRAEDLASSSHVKSIYIASVQYNSDVILQAHWIPSLLQLVKELQAVDLNVYVSIYESGSEDGTKATLSELAASLKSLSIDHTVHLDNETHAAAIEKSLSSTSTSGWLRTRYGKELRRISYLANVRNRALEPLRALNQAGIRFDKVLFLNDVVHSAEDAISLLNTRDGKYAAACALDFMNPPWNHVSGRALSHPAGLYDDFATRDSNGHVLGSHLFPYFKSPKSMAAILAREAIPVQSCWNGLVAFEAEPFQSTSKPLRFRSIPDSLAKFHVEASECCLIHYDNPISVTAGVWINPAVRVGYSSQAYAAVTEGEWPTTSELRWGKWKSKWTWWFRDPFPSLKASLRIWLWRRRYPNISEPGLACVQDLAMVITADGWRLRGANFE